MICSPAGLILFTGHPLGNAGLVYDFTEAESQTGSIVCGFFLSLGLYPFPDMDFIKVDPEPWA